MLATLKLVNMFIPALLQIKVFNCSTSLEKDDSPHTNLDMQDKPWLTLWKPLGNDMSSNWTHPEMLI